MKIVADSSVMFDIEQGAERGLEILPLTVSIGKESWAEYEDIDATEFLRFVRGGALPTSASPSPHSILEAYDTDEEVLHLSMASGLSGAYDVACGLKDQARHPERIHVLNTETLCVPHRVLALCAVELSKVCNGIHEVADRLQPLIDSAHSYLLPEDFDYLRRGGRLTPLAAKIVHLLKAAPVMMQTDDGTRLEKLTVARSFKKAVGAVAADMQKRGVGASFYLGISHAGNSTLAQTASQLLSEALPSCRQGVFNLGPAFITQGGPGCIAIQAIDLATAPDISVA